MYKKVRGVEGTRDDGFMSIHDGGGEFCYMSTPLQWIKGGTDMTIYSRVQVHTEEDPH
jgi:hypothetical protein